MLKDAGTGIVIVGNKWDLLPDKTTHSSQLATQTIRASLPHLHWAPILFTSATTGHGVEAVLKTALQVAQNRRRELAPEALTEILAQLTRRHRPVQAKGTRRPKLFALRQLASNPPVFEIEIRALDTIHFSYIRFIENQIRASADFTGVPITIKLKVRKFLTHGADRRPG
jgi:GTP-binding protein